LASVLRFSTSSRSDQTQIPAPVPLVPIRRDTFDQNPLAANPVVREQARFVVVWLVRRYGAGFAEWDTPQ